MNCVHYVGLAAAARFFLFRTALCGFRFAFCRFFCAAHGFSSGNFELLADIDASGALGHAVGRPDIVDTHAEFFGDFIEVVAAAHGVGSCLGLGLFGARRTLGT